MSLASAIFFVLVLVVGGGLAVHIWHLRRMAHGRAEAALEREVEDLKAAAASDAEIANDLEHLTAKRREGK